MKKTSDILKNGVITVVILCITFVLGLLIQNTLGAQALIPAIFMLGTFLTSVITEGYAYGITSALASVIAVNYAFTFPYFKFNFTMPENPDSFTHEQKLKMLQGIKEDSL